MKRWKSLPILLKVLSVALSLWMAMSIAVLVSMPEREIAFFGMLLNAPFSLIVVALLDCVSPLLFLYAMWMKLRWGAYFGMAYNGVFILNNIVALFMFKDVFGNGIYFPLVTSILFFCIIFKERKNFL